MKQEGQKGHTVKHKALAIPAAHRHPESFGSVIIPSLSTPALLTSAIT